MSTKNIEFYHYFQKHFLKWEILVCLLLFFIIVCNFVRDCVIKTHNSKKIRKLLDPKPVLYPELLESLNLRRHISYLCCARASLEVLFAKCTYRISNRWMVCLWVSYESISRWIPSCPNKINFHLFVALPSSFTYHDCLKY